MQSVRQFRVHLPHQFEEERLHLARRYRRMVKPSPSDRDYPPFFVLGVLYCERLHKRP